MKNVLKASSILIACLIHPAVAKAMAGQVVDNIVIPLYETTDITQTNPVGFIEINGPDTRTCTTSAPDPQPIILPSIAGQQGQVLGLADSSGHLTWLTTTTNSTQLNLLYTATSADIPLTLVLRDNTGSFVATNITVTGQIMYQGGNGQAIAFSAPATVAAYALTLPGSGPTSINQALLSNGAGGLMWTTVTTSSMGVQSINTATAVNQFLSTSTNGLTLGFTTIASTTNQLNIPYAGNVTGANVGLITGQDWANFESTYLEVQAATPNDTPSTLVLRNNAGSFAATNVTVTAVVFQGQGGTLTLTATTLPGNETLVWPTTAPSTNQALFYTGNNQLAWITTLTGGIENLNGATAPVQFLATTTVGTNLGFFNSVNSNTLVIPYAGNVTGANVGLITGQDWQNFENTYTTVLAATPADTPNTLVLRNSVGSFAATNVTVTAVVFQGQGGTLTLTATTLPGNETLVWPTTAPVAGQVLGYGGSNQLVWTNTTNTTLLTATSCDVPLTLITRDTTGSFIATTITLTGNSLINFSSGNACLPGSGFIFAPTNGNTIIGTNAGNNNTLTGTNNVALGFNALMNVINGIRNVAIGAQALQNTTGGGQFVGPFDFGSDNIAIGFNALGSNINNFANIAIGTDALASMTSVFFNIGNIAIGSGASENYIGNQAQPENIAIGVSSLFNNVNGGGNVALGSSTLLSTTFGSNNTAIGFLAMQENFIGNNNTAVGAATLQTATCNFITVVGAGAGLNLNPPTAPFNRTVLGAGATGTVDNSVTLGNTAVTAVLPGADNVASLGSTTTRFSAVNTFTINLYDTQNNDAAITSPATYNNSYTLKLPTSQGTQFQVLSTSGTNPSQLSWITTVTNATQLNLLNTATSCDIPSTLVLRDTTGSFIATTVTLTGNSLINFSSGNACFIGQGFVFAPTNQNTIIGLNAGNNNTLTGIANTAYGYYALQSDTTGASNTALGYYAMKNAVTSQDTAVGYQALENDTSTGGSNIAVGYKALANPFSGSGGNNIAIGVAAMGQASSGNQNVAVGSSTLFYNAGGANNVAVGSFAIGITQQPVSNDTAVGYYALSADTVGNNAAFGYYAMINASAGQDTAIGIGTLTADTGSGANTAVGYYALNTANPSSGADVAVGYQALSEDTSTGSNTAVGYQSLRLLNGGTGQNVAVGVSTMSGVSTGAQNVAVGALALGSASAATSRETAVGTQALQHDNGAFNTGIGYYALQQNTTGTSNTAVGYYALQQNMTGTGNIALGYQTATNLTTGGNNIYIGNNLPAGSATEVNTTRIGGPNMTACYIQGIANTTTPNNPNVFVSSTGQLFQSTGSATLTATSCGTPLNLVLRDTTGSFVATTITLTGVSLINYGTSACSTGSGFVWAPTNNNTIIGLAAGNNNTLTGGFNTALGNAALSKNTNAAENTAVGYQAGQNITGNGVNVAVGYQALQSTGFGNVAVGSQAMGTNTGNINQNTAVGANALQNDANGLQVAVGYQALLNNTTGFQNTGLGFYALRNNIIGNQNTALGYQALMTNTWTSNNVAIGDSALLIMNTASQLGQHIAIGSQAMSNANPNAGVDIAIGYQALQNDTNGDNLAIGTQALQVGVNGGGNFYFNVAVGNFALQKLIAGHQNTAIGRSALTTNTFSGNNVAVGDFALQYAVGASNSAGSNVAVGSGAGIGSSAANVNNGTSNVIIGQGAMGNGVWTSGSNNVAIGAAAGLGITTGSDNVIMGQHAAPVLTTGAFNVLLGQNVGAVALNSSFNIAIGNSALNNTITGSQIAIGSGAMLSNSTGAQNIGIGYQSLFTNGTGSNNTALGYYSIFGQNGGNNNTAVGAYTLPTSVIFSNCTAVGYYALNSNANSGNTAVGFQASQLNSTGINNTAMGSNALLNNTVSSITAMGAYALNGNTSGTNNTGVGYYSLFNNKTGNQNTALGYYAMLGVSGQSDGGTNTAIGYYAGMSLEAISGLTAGGNGNTIVGANSGTALTSGFYNTILGAGSGNALTANILGSQGAIGNIIIGQGAATSLNEYYNVVIGQGAATAYSGIGSVIIGQGAAPDLGVTGSPNITNQNVIIGAGAAPTLNAGQNVIIGDSAGSGISGATNNIIIIGYNVAGANLSGSTYIGNLSGAGVTGGTEVVVATSNWVGTASSSARYKENIKDIDSYSEKIYQLRPVLFNYIADETKCLEAGLIAEEIEDIYPEFVVYKDGLPETIRYQHLRFLMLNEQQKDHKELYALKAHVGHLEQEIAELKEKLMLLLDH